MNNWIEQFSTSNSWDSPALTPEQKLWRAALQRALLDLTRENGQSDYRAFKSAKEWIQNGSEISFILCCEALNMPDGRIKELRNFATNCVYNGPMTNFEERKNKQQKVLRQRKIREKQKLVIISLTPEQRRAKAFALRKLQSKIAAEYRKQRAQGKLLKSA